MKLKYFIVLMFILATNQIKLILFLNKVDGPKCVFQRLGIRASNKHNIRSIHYTFSRTAHITIELLF